MSDPCEVCSILFDEIWNCDTCFRCRYNEDLYDPDISFEDPDVAFVAEFLNDEMEEL